MTVLVENLQALGYDIGALPRQSSEPVPGRGTGGVGTELTTGVLEGLKRWQHDTGRKPTGTLDPGRATVLSGPWRVDTVMAQLGDPAAESVLTLTSQEKTVTVKVDAGSADSIHKGAEVTIILPDIRVFPARSCPSAPPCRAVATPARATTPTRPPPSR
ncbi:hypothetical protein [Streptomyces milbemycinicus]|uniref:hypothetical protein n=1 Tax=Streptomyces milbemycinicus TaxID=476552 RepID=UPI0033CAAC21